MAKLEPPRGVADIIAESQRLRDELLKTAAQLGVFADQLAEEVAKLKVRQEEFTSGPRDDSQGSSGD